MKNIIIYPLFLTAVIALFSSGLYAFGMGAYATATKGSYEWEYNIDQQEDPLIDSVSRKTGFGFMLDTALAYNTLFNYRLQIGYSAIKIDNDSNAYDISGKEFHAYSSFGFGILRSDIARFWFGPQLGIGFINGEYDLPYSLENQGNYFWTLYFSAGIVAGVNLNVGRFITFAIDFGYRAAAGFGTAEMASTDIGVQVTGSEGFVNLCAVLRLNDNYNN